LLPIVPSPRRDFSIPPRDWRFQPGIKIEIFLHLLRKKRALLTFITLPPTPLTPITRGSAISTRLRGGNGEKFLTRLCNSVSTQTVSPAKTKGRPGISVAESHERAKVDPEESSPR